MLQFLPIYQVRRFDYSVIKLAVLKITAKLSSGTTDEIHRKEWTEDMIDIYGLNETVTYSISLKVSP